MPLFTFRPIYRRLPYKLERILHKALLMRPLRTPRLWCDNFFRYFRLPIEKYNALSFVLGNLQISPSHSLEVSANRDRSRHLQSMDRWNWNKIAKGSMSHNKAFPWYWESFILPDFLCMRGSFPFSSHTQLVRHFLCLWFDWLRFKANQSYLLFTSAIVQLCLYMWTPCLQRAGPMT